MSVRTAILGGAAAALLVAVAAPASAQSNTSTPSSPPLASPSGIDVAVSYSLLHDSEIGTTLPVGWVVAANGWYDSVGIVGEAGGNYKTESIGGIDVTYHVHSFLAGARLGDYRHQQFVPFGQVLVGLARLSASAFGTGGVTNAFALQPGGGVDIRWLDNLALRLQGDYRWVHGTGGHANELRFAAGVVVNVLK